MVRRPRALQICRRTPVPRSSRCFHAADPASVLHAAPCFLCGQPLPSILALFARVHAGLSSVAHARQILPVKGSCSARPVAAFLAPHLQTTAFEQGQASLTSGVYPTCFPHSPSADEGLVVAINPT